MAHIMKDRWTEPAVLALPLGESDWFERKSAQWLEQAQKNLGKPLSAFANSGGGYLIIGLANDGNIEGVNALVGRTPTREWLEQVIPTTLDPQLREFRVHTVERAASSQIPPNKELIVVDVGDSSLAPHQCRSTLYYYWRQGSHSKPAPNYFLENLRSRLIGPSLRAELVGARHVYSGKTAGGALFVAIDLLFEVINSGRAAAYRWAVIVDNLVSPSPGREPDYIFRQVDFPIKRGRPSAISLDETILPSLRAPSTITFGIQLRPETNLSGGLEGELRRMIPPSLEIEYHVVGETMTGTPERASLARVIDSDAMAAAIRAAPS